MPILEESYLTPYFSDAAMLPRNKQLDFLSLLRGNIHFQAGKDDATFRDATLFCINAANVPLHAFAREMVISASLLRLWTKGDNLPYERTNRVTQMIDTALYQNGWTGKPPFQPVMDGSNVVQLNPHAPH